MARRIVGSRSVISLARQRAAATGRTNRLGAAVIGRAETIRDRAELTSLLPVATAPAAALGVATRIP